jgi:1,4-dihydroxy-2-naphthoate octaprenyltransferase
MSPLTIWIRASRLRTLPAALVPVAMGTVLAHVHGQLHVAAALTAAFGALLIQLGTNYANDYFDFVKGADTDARVGEQRATAAGWVTPQAMKRAFIGTFALAALVAVALVLRGGWPIIVIGVLSIAFGILYTGGPRPLGYMGLGDVLVLVFFGPVAVAGTVYVQSLSFSWSAALAGLAPGLISTAILAVNNLRDVKTDVLVGKRTLPVRFGRPFGVAEYALCWVGALLVPVILVVGGAPLGALVPLALAPLAIKACVDVARAEGAALDPLLARTGKLLVVYGALFCVGWLV